MPSDKRERQRQNRALKEAEEAKIERRQRRWSLVKRYGMYTILFIIALILLNVFFG